METLFLWVCKRTNCSSWNKQWGQKSLRTTEHDMDGIKHCCATFPFFIAWKQGCYFWKFPIRNQTIQNRGNVSAAIHQCLCLVPSQHFYTGSLVHSCAPKYQNSPAAYLLSYVTACESLWNSLQTFLLLNIFLFILLNILVDSISSTCKKHLLRFISSLYWDRREERWENAFLTQKYHEMSEQGQNTV